MCERVNNLRASSSVSVILSSMTTLLLVPKQVAFVSCRHALNG